MKTFNQYEDMVMELAVYPNSGMLLGLLYTALGLCGEAGEVAEKIKKTLRDHGGVFTSEIKMDLLKELGDVLWYITAMANELGVPLQEVAKVSEKKLRDRAARGVLHGKGDNR